MVKSKSRQDTAKPLTQRATNPEVLGSEHGKNLHICLCTDDNYIEHTAIAITSIVVNSNVLDQYHFYILSSGIKRKNRIALKRLRRIRPLEIKFISIPQWKLSPFAKLKLCNHVNLSTFTRLLIPDLLPSLDKVICLDSDLIVRDDMSSIMSVDLTNHWVAGVEDVNPAYLAQLIKLPDDKYINTGVIVLNTKEMRKNNYHKIMCETINRHYDLYTIGDQDLINDAFHSKIALMSYRFNMFHEWHGCRKIFHPKNEEDYEESVRHPIIVHFVGPKKPWIKGCDRPYASEYFDYKRIFEQSTSPKLNEVKIEKVFSNGGFIREKKILGIPYDVKKVQIDTVDHSYFFGLYREWKNGNSRKIFLCGMPLICSIFSTPIRRIRILGMTFYKKSEK